MWNEMCSSYMNQGTTSPSSSAAFESGDYSLRFPIKISLNILRNEQRHSAAYFILSCPQSFNTTDFPALVHSPGSLDCLSESKVQGCHLPTLLLCAIWVRVWVWSLPPANNAHKTHKTPPPKVCSSVGRVCVTDKGPNKKHSLWGLSFSCWPRCTPSLLSCHYFGGHFFFLSWRSIHFNSIQYTYKQRAKHVIFSTVIEFLDHNLWKTDFLESRMRNKGLTWFQ